MRGVGVVKSKVSPVTLPATFVGRRLLRKEDTRFLTGAARYVGDAGPPRMLHITFVRSTHAHARIGRIRLEAALAVPGVVAAYTGTKIHALAKPIRTPFGAASYKETDYPLLATGKVRFAGEPLVAIAAGSRYVAEDAAALVDVEYQPLEPLVSIDDAIAASTSPYVWRSSQ